MDTNLKVLETLGTWVSSDKNPYKVNAKVVQRRDKKEPELLFIKEFYSKGNLFQTTKLGRINKSLAGFIVSCINTYITYPHERV